MTSLYDAKIPEEKGEETRLLTGDCCPSSAKRLGNHLLFFIGKALADGRLSLSRVFLNFHRRGDILIPSPKIEGGFFSEGGEKNGKSFFAGGWGKIPHRLKGERGVRSMRTRGGNFPWGTKRKSSTSRFRKRGKRKGGKALICG